MKIWICLLIYTCASLNGLWARDLAELHQLQGNFAPVAADDHFYADSMRQAKIKIIASNPNDNSISPYLFGVNTSYFNDTDQIWETYNIPKKLKTARVSAMRFPGGEETSFYHFEHPGVNGYEDVLDPSAKKGYAPMRGPFQETWRAPEQWKSNKDFMDFDEFMGHCQNIGAEPVVGLNLSSGKKRGDSASGLEEALRWMRYAKKKGYAVKYWFLDNEPWHFEAAYCFKGDEYAKEVRTYAKAIKSEFPECKLIVNPISSEHLSHPHGLQSFLDICGEFIDLLDVHLYWAWGLNSFDYWQKNTPLSLADKWHLKTTKSIQDGLIGLKKHCEKMGYGHLELAVLEWNTAPSDHNPSYSQAFQAILQAEMLFHLIRADVKVACMWPLLWRTKREIWAEQDVFPTLIQQKKPYKSTVSQELFRQFDALKSAKLLSSKAISKKIELVVAEADDVKYIYIINKLGMRRQFEAEGLGKVKLVAQTSLGIKTQCWESHDLKEQDKVFLEPYSLNILQYQSN